MKLWKKTSVRVVSVVLSTLMCATAVPFTAFGATLDDDPAGENGPAAQSAYVAISDGVSWKYPYRVSTGAASVLDGAAVYDKDTNTLTLTNLNANTIETNKMGEDFKIRLVGRNVATTGVNIWGDAWGASANITGDGTLTAFGVTVMAEGAPAVFEVGADARVTAEGGGIHVYDSSTENPLRFSGKERYGGKAGKIRSTTPGIRPSWDKDSVSYGETLYYNPTRPYQQHSQYETTEYFAVQRNQGTATRNKDKKTMKYVSFTLREVRKEDGMYVWYSTITQIYVWEDTDLYQRYKNNLDDLMLEAYDPTYQRVVEESYSDSEWAVVNNLGEALEYVDIVPKNANVMMVPMMEAADMAEGMVDKFYTAQLHADPANGGAITDYAITGSASEWLNINSQGKLSGKPKAPGVYSLFVTAVETAGGKTIESLPQRYRIIVKQPANFLFFSATVSDKAAHTLTIVKKDNSFTKTMDVGNDIIGEGKMYSLDGLTPGDYTVTFTGTLNGATVSYSSPTADFTIADGENNTVSFNPGTATITPDADSIVLRVNNFNVLKDSSAYLIFHLANGGSFNREVKEELNIYPGVLEGVNVQSYELCVMDNAFRMIRAMSGEMTVNGNQLTANASLENITEYTVTGVPAEIQSLYIYVDDSYAFRYEQPQNAWETPTFRLGTLGADAALRAEVNSYGIKEEAYVLYNLSAPLGVTVSGKEIHVDVLKLNREGVISGKVTAPDGSAVAAASVSCSQTVNHKSKSLSTVTDKNGVYRFEGLIAGTEAKVIVSTEDHLDESKTVPSVAGDSVADISLKTCGYLTLNVDYPLSNAVIRWDGNTRYNQNGTSFRLPVPADTTKNVAVSVNSATTMSISGTASVKKGYGSLTLNPIRRGFIDTSGVNEKGEPVAEYSATSHILYIARKNSNSWEKEFPGSKIILDPGMYIVEIRDTVKSDSVYAKQELEVKSGETAYLTASVPEQAEKIISGSVSAPSSAPTGETYKVECIINSHEELDSLYFAVPHKNDYDWDSGVKGVVINGKTAGIDHNYINVHKNPQIDWSFPLRATFYVEQRATSETGSQMFVLKAMNKYAESSLVDVAYTAYAPNISLRIPDAVGSIKTTTETGQAAYAPDSLHFSGNTEPNAEVTLYDNDTMVAKAQTNSNGKYEGNLTLASSDAIHRIRAEVTSGGKTMSAQDYCTYRPGGAVLRNLWMISTSAYGDYALCSDPLTPGSKFGYTTGIGGYNCRFKAAIDNPDQLDDVTYTVDGKDVTGKVFFKITTVDGDRIVKAEPNSNLTQWYTQNLTFENVYPTGVKVLYRSKSADHSYTDKFTDKDGSESSLNVDLGVKRTGENKDGFDVDEWMKLTLDGYNGEDPDVVGAQTNGEKVSADDLYNAMVTKLNQGSGEGRYRTLTAEQAAVMVPENKAEIRTYTDEPKWTVNDQNLHLRMVELQQKGYETYTYVDEATGHKFYLFSGTFYYAKDATPVPSQQITKVYSGIVKTEDDPRLFKDGVMIGSTLEVKYLCDVTAGKWYRTQTATMPGGVRSAIHTSSYQIPCRTDAPFSYKDTNVFPVSAPESEAVGAMVGGKPSKQGLSFEIDFSRVSAKTYVGGAISIGGFAYGKMASATYFEGVKVVNKQTNQVMDLVDIGLDKAINKGKNIFYAGVTKESMVSGCVVYKLSKMNDEYVQGSTTVDDVYDAIYNQIRDNIRYYGKVKTAANYTAEHDNAGVIGDFSLDKYKADRMLQKSKEMADAVVELQREIENAQHQDEFTSRVTEQIGQLSIAASCAPGVGTEAALILDAMCFIMSAANDTRNSKVHDAAEKFMEKYRNYIADDEQVKDEIAESEERIEQYKKWGFDVKSRSDIINEDMKKKKKKMPSGGGGGGTGGGDEPGGENPGADNAGGNNTGAGDVDVEMTPAHDPSGRVYEAVGSNTIEGATVTLYNYAGADKPMNRWDDSDNLKQSNPLTTDADGFYRWDVPEGEWYVTAEKEGYEQGSSQNDAAATVSHNGVNYLPVLPPKLDVNIPLVSYSAPTVEAISAKSDGVYVTFSKYMDESTIVPGNFELLDENGKPISFKLEKLDSEQAPSNIQYGGAAPFYTKTVRLSTELALDKEFFVKVSEKLTSYAGTPMLSAYSDAVYADEKRTLTAPVFSVEPGEVERNSTVTITAPEGAKVIYTTDGSEPSPENGKLAKSGTAVVITSDMTIKAIAVKLDAVASAVTSADYTVKVHVDTSVEPTYTLGDVNNDGKIDITDATLIQRYAAEIEELDDTQLLAADANGDGKVNIADATTIQNYIAEIIDRLGRS